MRMSQHVDSDAARAIQIALPRGRQKPSSFSALEGYICACIGRQQVRGHGLARPFDRKAMQNEMCRLSGRHAAHSKSATSSVNTAGSAIELPAYAGFLRITQMNMWTALGRTLAPESPHIVGFGRRDTIYRVQQPTFSSCVRRQTTRRLGRWLPVGEGGFRSGTGRIAAHRLSPMGVARRERDHRWIQKGSEEGKQACRGPTNVLNS